MSVMYNINKQEETDKRIITKTALTTSLKEQRKSLPWIEKYRPSQMVNIKLDDQIKKQVEKMIMCKDVPNIILEGPPGVGKTTTLKCIAKNLYGSYYKDMVLEMNASDDRGIKIRDPIESFRKAFIQVKNNDKLPKFKLVILDEADNMTDKAKHIISEFIKKNVSDLRFAFTCNSKDNIISAIQSGCHIVKYPPLSDKSIINRMTEICTNERIITDDMSKAEKKEILKGLNAISQITNGDLRHSINILQMSYNRFKTINEKNVYAIQDRPHPEKSKDIIMCCINNDLPNALKKSYELVRAGYSGTDIALGLRTALRLDICNDIDEGIKVELWKCISYSAYNISKGLDSSFLQIASCVASMYKCVRQ